MSAHRINVATMHRAAALAAAWHADRANERHASRSSLAFAALSKRLHWRAARATLLAIVAGF